MLTTLEGSARVEAYTLLSAMSAEQLTAFWEAVEADASLQDKLRASIDGEIDTPLEAAAVVAIAKDAGFTITAGDLLRADAQAILELNDEELEKVAGGMSFGDGSVRFLEKVAGGDDLGGFWRRGATGVTVG
jgi:predicted ribosomally synthesized peptide with nif11-like leader